MVVLVGGLGLGFLIDNLFGFLFVLVMFVTDLLTMLLSGFCFCFVGYCVCNFRLWCFYFVGACLYGDLYLSVAGYWVWLLLLVWMVGWVAGWWI